MQKVDGGDRTDIRLDAEGISGHGVIARKLE